MVGMGRIVGIIFIVIGLAVGLIGGAWLLSGMSAGKADNSALILGLGILVVVLVLPLVGFGGYLLIKGNAEKQEFAQMEKERDILNAVTTRGQAKVAELALEFKMSRSEFKDALYDLVGKELFTGYIDWKEGVVYAREASQLNTGTCPSCGAPRSVAGKGIIKCEYCGAETFLPATT